MPENFPDFKKEFGYGGFIQLEHHRPGFANMRLDTGKFFREIESNCWDPIVRIEDLIKTDVDVQVLSTIPVLFSYWTKPKHGLKVSEYLNNHIANITDKYPDRFVGLATLPMQDPDLAIEELRRCVVDLGITGIQIGSHINSKGLEDKGFHKLYQLAQELDVSIFVHPWDMPYQEEKYWAGWLVGMPAETSLAITSLIFGGVFDKFPKLRWAFAHGGGSFPATIGRVEHGFNVRPDLCAVDNNVNPREYLGKFWIDSLVHDSKALTYLIDLFGSNRVALGSDYPFPLGEHVPGALIDSMDNLTQDEKTNLLSKSAFEWLNLSYSDFAKS